MLLEGVHLDRHLLAAVLMGYHLLIGEELAMTRSRRNDRIVLCVVDRDGRRDSRGFLLSGTAI